VEVLTREGYSVEAIDSTYRCMARVVEDPADLVVLGLAGISDVELELVPALREERNAPRIVVIFPPSLREMAARALSMGADTYLLEPFYSTELQRVVASLLEPAGAPPLRALPAPQTGALQQLAQEVAHAVNNPLQIVRLLLDKKNVTKKELEEGLPPQLDRIEQMIALLREFGAYGPGKPRRVPAEPPVQRAAEAAGILVRARGVPAAHVDEAHYTAALTALFCAVQERADPDSQLIAEQSGDGDEVTVRLTVSEDAFGGEELGDLEGSVFVVGPERSIRPGLALPRMLLEEAGGRLEIDRSGGDVTFRASVPTA
jgi:DNA-binding response OmpR family regulator